MAKKIVTVLLVALASLHEIQALGLYDTPFPSDLDEETDYPNSTFAPISYSWSSSISWLESYTSSYSQILRYEIEDTLQSRLVYFTDSVDTGAVRYKHEVEDIVTIITRNSSTSLKCTQDNLEPIKQMVSSAEEQLKECTVVLKGIGLTYESVFMKLMALVTQKTEEPFYAPCVKEYDESGYTVTGYNRAQKCYNTNLQRVLDDIYNSGVMIHNKVVEMRKAVKSARDESYACAKQALSPSTERAISEGVTTLKRECGVPAPLNRQKRGFGKKFKKFLKKAKNGVKKICRKVPCKIGYSIPIGK